MSKALDVLDKNIEITQRYLSYIMKVNPGEVNYFEDCYILNDNLRRLFNTIKKALIKEHKLSIDIVYDYCIADEFNIDKNDIQLIYDAFDNFDVKYLRRQLEQQYQKQVLNKQALENVLTHTTSADDIDTTKLQRFYDQLGKGLSMLERHKDISFKSNIKRFEEKYNKRQNGEIKDRSIGDLLIDKYLPYAGEAGDMIGIAMRTGTGKTTYALKLALNLAKMKTPTIYFSLDMGEATIINRILCIKEGLTLEQILMKNKPPTLERRIRRALREYKNDPYFVLCTEPSISLKGVDKFIYESKDIFRESGVLDNEEYCAVFIDTVDIIDEFGEANAYGNLAAINNLHEITRRQKCFTNILLQINENKLREKRKLTPEDIDSLIPLKSDIWGSSAFSKRCRVVIIGERLRHLKEELFPNHEDIDMWREAEEDILTLWCVKSNDGSIFKLDYLFDPIHYGIIPKLIEKKIGV